VGSRGLIADQSRRAYGKARPSEEELDAIKGSGFQLVYVQRPEIDPEIPQQQELPAPKPDFLDAEIVTGEQGFHHPPVYSNAR
jgi:hypothetical protein